MTWRAWTMLDPRPKLTAVTEATALDIVRRLPRPAYRIDWVEGVCREYAVTPDQRRKLIDAIAGEP